MQDILVGIFTDYLDNFVQLRRSNVSHEIPDKVLFLMYHIAVHLERRTTPKELCEELNLPYNETARVFKKTVGTSISAYILEQKIFTAKRLLSFTDHNVSEVSYILGFYDNSDFSNKFKRIVGISPKKYQKNTLTL